MGMSNSAQHSPIWVATKARSLVARGHPVIDVFFLQAHDHPVVAGSADFLRRIVGDGGEGQQLSLPGSPQRE
jgi:hypothetical protein